MKLECRLPAEVTSVAAARTFVTAALAGQSPDAVFRAELMVSELATNCILHAGSPFIVRLASAGRALRIEVSDDGGGRPVLRSPGPSDPRGRGLQLVDKLSTSWGIQSSPRRRGKTLWFALLSPPSGVAPRGGTAH